MSSSPFRLIDVLVCLVVVIALGVTAAGARRGAQENSVIIACAGRLGQIGQSLVLYQGLYDGRFPRTRYDPAAPLTAYTAPAAADPFSDTGPQPNDVTASLFLLARVMELPPENFICPSALRHGLAEIDSFDRVTVKNRSNFRSRLGANYSLANMYPDAAATAAGYSLDHFRDRLPATFVIAGDTNPGGESAAAATTHMSRMNLRMANSPNHERNGQNVMFADGSVRFFNSAFIGDGYDNVYTGRPDNVRQPKAATDTVLLPLWTEGPQGVPRSTLFRRWVLGVSAVVTFGLMFWVVRHGMAKRAG